MLDNQSRGDSMYMVHLMMNPIKYLKKNIDRLAAVDKAVNICINPSAVAVTFEESPPAKLTMVSFIIEFTSDAVVAAVDGVIFAVIKSAVMLSECFIYDVGIYKCKEKRDANL